MHEIGPFSIPAIRNFVPEKIKPWIIIVFVIIFQFSGGIYLAAVSEMVGGLALMQEDIMMAGYSSFVGMGLTFAIMFRLKFRFNTKVAFFVCAIVLIVSNLITMHTTSVPVLVITCFFAGIFRMWATFECNSTIQLWLTPKRDLSVFFCFIYLLVQGCIQLSGITTIYMAVWTNWENMHWLIIGLLILLMFATLVLFRNYRSMRKLPLWGIDWLGAFMWGITLLCILFVCIYGEHYDWYQSWQIRSATCIGIVILLLNIWRASFIRHPFIALKTWSYEAVYINFILYILIDFLLAPSHLFEHIYMEAILGYDALNVISLNWIVFAGVVSGAIFTYITFARLKWKYKTMIVIAFLMILGYLMWFYFHIDYNVSKESLMLPIYLRSVAYVIIAICFLTALSKVPFQHFFEAVSVQAFVSAAIGGPIGIAILEHLMKGATAKNAMLLSSNMDRVNSAIIHFPLESVYGSMQKQALMISMKEIYGWLSLLAIFCLLLFMIKESSLRPKLALHPRYRVIRRWVKHELRSSNLLKIKTELFNQTGVETNE